MNVSMYKALTSAGAAEALAIAAAETVPSDPATKADIVTAVAELRAWLLWRMLVAMGAQAGLFVALIKLFN